MKHNRVGDSVRGDGDYCLPFGAVMKKTPTLFERDWNGNKDRVLDKVHPGSEWVLAGEGVATRKIDGTCCMVRGGKLFKRREVKAGQKTPPLFESAGTDEETGKTVGWVPVGDGPEDFYHREAFATSTPLADGTYELIGPKVQGNPEKVPAHWLIRHGEGLAGPLYDAPRTFGELAEYFSRNDIEGIVWHHPDGRMVKIKKRDFGGLR